MLFKWLTRRRDSKPKAKPEILPITHGVTLAIWQSRPEHVKWARDLFRTAEGIDMLSVIRNELPFHFKGASPEYSLGAIWGYMEAFNVLTSLAMHPLKAPEDVPVTYEQSADDSQQDTQ